MYKLAQAIYFLKRFIQEEKRGGRDERFDVRERKGNKGIVKWSRAK